MFYIKYGFFEYLIIPFRLTNAPALEQELMNDIFKNILDEYMVIYLDDILVYSRKVLKDYIEKVYEVFRHFDK